ncbi:MAG TPA: TetR/AcrR family transcriptional regulator [Phenylobacterium sp.]
MRYLADHKQRTRERVLQEAASAIRAEGLHRIAVASVMAKVGLTHGGFYAHFSSKDAFIAAAIDQMFKEGGDRLRLSLDNRTPAEGLADYIDFYLSAAHRDATTSGCPLPYLSADAPRLAPAMRAQVVCGIGRLTDQLATTFAAMGQADPVGDASSALAEMVGAVCLSRADTDPVRANQVLERTRTSLRRRLGLTAQR